MLMIGRGGIIFRTCGNFFVVLVLIVIVAQGLGFGTVMVRVLRSLVGLTHCSGRPAGEHCRCGRALERDHHKKNPNDELQKPRHKLSLNQSGGE